MVPDPPLAHSGKLPLLVIRNTVLVAVEKRNVGGRAAEVRPPTLALSDMRIGCGRHRKSLRRPHLLSSFSRTG